MTKDHTEYGDPRALDSEILRSVVGSGVLGIAIEGTDDHDEMGIYIEPVNDVLGIRKVRGDYIWRTQPEGARSGHGDVDLVLYSLRKYLALATKGNPTALTPLFAPEDALVTTTMYGRMLRTNRDWFLSTEAIERFLGYMHSQHERMMGGGKRNRVPNRPELIEKFGWDVKYGSHALRLAHQGYELATQGTLTLPLSDELRERVLSVKRGEVSRDEVSAEITYMEELVRELLLLGKTVLPPEPNIAKIEDFSVYAHQGYWRNNHV
jgi:hypothetical protein